MAENNPLENNGWQWFRLSCSYGYVGYFPDGGWFQSCNDDGEAINGYDRSLFFKNRDPRFYYTFTFSGVNGDMIRMQMP